MNIQEYIASGILDTYVLGAASPREVAEVEKMMAEHKEIRDEVFEIQKALNSYVVTFEKDPPAALKDKIKAELFGKSAETGSDNIKPLHSTEASEQNIRPLNGGGFKWQFAASWALLALSIMGNYYLFTQWKSSENKLAEATSKNEILANNADAFKASYENSIAVLESNEYKKIALKSADGKSDGGASVYFNAKSQEVFLAKLDLPAAPEGKQYQLWALVDGKPVDAGLISSANLAGKMKNISNAAGFAVSLESSGGSTTEAGPKGPVLLVGMAS